MTFDQRVGLYEACQQLSPIHPDHATLPIQEGFNWSSAFGDARFERLYLVVFRSVLRATADVELLYEHDELAHGEATEAGGLLFYFRGDINERRESRRAPAYVLLPRSVRRQGPRRALLDLHPLQDRLPYPIRSLTHLPHLV